MSSAPRLFLIDGHAYLYRAYHAIPYLSTSKGIPTNATLGFTTMLWKILREDAPEYIGVVFDSPGPTLRHQAFEAYKENRPGMPPDLAQQIPWVKRTLVASRITTMERPGYEADDLLAALALSACKSVEVVLVTQDKDALQLVGPRVRVLALSGRAGERVVFDESKVEERWGVPPARIPDLLALIGDHVDNIPGVPGVGEVTAVKLLKQFGGLEALYQSLPLVGNAKLREALARHRDQVFQARDLIRLADVPDLDATIEQFRRQEPDWKALRALWEELQLSSLLKSLPGREDEGDSAVSTNE